MTKSPSPTPSMFLPEDFAPSGKDIIVGRGKKCTNHVGNRRMKAMVHSKLQEYSTANDKTHKTYIISQILHDIKSAAGRFVKKESASRRWYQVRDPCARTNIAQCFRDALHDDYRSSKFSKQRRRWNTLHSPDPKEEAEEAPARVVEDSPVAKTPEAVPSLLPASSKTNNGSLNLRHILRNQLPQQQVQHQQVLAPIATPPMIPSASHNLNGSNLRAILSAALNVVEEPISNVVSDQDTFNCLFTANFFPEPLGDDPFEPTPIGRGFCSV